MIQDSVPSCSRFGTPSPQQLPGTTTGTDTPSVSWTKTTTESNVSTLSFVQSFTEDQFLKRLVRQSRYRRLASTLPTNSLKVDVEFSLTAAICNCSPIVPKSIENTVDVAVDAPLDANDSKKLVVEVICQSTGSTRNLKMPMPRLIKLAQKVHTPLTYSVNIQTALPNTVQCTLKQWILFSISSIHFSKFLKQPSLTSRQCAIKKTLVLLNHKYNCLAVLNYLCYLFCSVIFTFSRPLPLYSSCSFIESFFLPNDNKTSTSESKSCTCRRLSENRNLAKPHIQHSIHM